jgi:Glycosyltransferase family 20
MIDVYPIGIDPKELLNLIESPKIQQRIQELRKSFAGKKIIVARDRLEKSNGKSILFFPYLFFSYHPRRCTSKIGCSRAPFGYTAKLAWQFGLPPNL